MLKVVVKKKDNKYYRITFLGHANFSDYGNDIVCSSASSIMITTVNAINSFEKNLITYEKKKDNFTIIVNKNNDITDNLLNNMLNMLNELSNEYPKNIKIEEE